MLVALAHMPSYLLLHLVMVSIEHDAWFLVSSKIMNVIQSGVIKVRTMIIIIQGLLGIIKKPRSPCCICADVLYYIIALIIVYMLVCVCNYAATRLALSEGKNVVTSAGKAISSTLERTAPQVMSWSQYASAASNYAKRKLWGSEEEFRPDWLDCCQHFALHAGVGGGAAVLQQPAVCQKGISAPSSSRLCVA